MGRILGIDFGTARIGLAISDERKVIASALPTLRVERRRDATMVQLQKILEPYLPIEKVVVGYPLLLSGKEGEMALLAKAFGTEVGQALSVPVVLWDERLTSSQVDRMLKDAEVSRKRRAQLSDQLAAVTILQNYLDSIRVC